jgi:uncharacterized protein
LSGRIYDGFVPGRHAIDAYGAGGFRFADMSHRGSILVLPSGIKAWTPVEGHSLLPEDFGPVFVESETVELLLLGTGRDIVPVSDEVRWRFREAGIRFDVMQTGAAARTYNILLAENRRVAAALIAVG